MTLIPQTYDWSHLLGESENPNGMVSQTANGTKVNGRGDDGKQWNWCQNADGERWNTNPTPDTNADAYFMGDMTAATGHAKERQMNQAPEAARPRRK